MTSNTLERCWKDASLLKGYAPASFVTLQRNLVNVCILLVQG
jgi:hypothetical protein